MVRLSLIGFGGYPLENRNHAALEWQEEVVPYVVIRPAKRTVAKQRLTRLPVIGAECV